MSDELEKLRAGLKAAPPAADPAARAKAMRRAMQSFDRHQETVAEVRPSHDRPANGGFMTGVRTMLSKLATRPALAASASVVALGIGLAMIVPLADRPVPRPLPKPVVAPTEAPLADARRDASAQRKETGASVAQSAEAEAMTANEADAPVVEEPMLEMAPVADGYADTLSRGDGAVAGLVAPSFAVAAPDQRLRTQPDTEAFANDNPNPVKVTTEEPVSTFSIDTDTASWSVIRSSLTNGQLPPKEAVRVEEMVNYFPYDYAAPEAGEAPFRASVSLFETPWNSGTQLLRIGLQGELPALADRPALNLVFLIDTSGSMDDPKKLPLLKQAFAMMLGELQPEDRVAIVTYAGSAGLVLEPTEASDRATILAALDRLGAGGSTAGAEGLQQAYQVAETMAGESRIGRILLATDGDFNVGLSDPEALKDFIAEKRETGTYLSVLGFGRGNLDDATMQALAQNGNGTAAYIDTAQEAQKVLVDQLSGALFPIADDVKIQVEFNPAVVAEYRLIGYETRALKREDFNNDKVDAGEIGAGHQVTALYEITPVGSPAVLNDPLRYGPATATGDAAELGFLKLRYKAPGEDTSSLIETAIPAESGAPDTDARFAAAVAGMGQLLSEPKYLGQWGWGEAIALANAARGDDPFGYRTEAVQLMRLAQSLSR
ncbi:MAG: VWA domain-containing protein [Paracoccaceae bacterium]